MRYKYTEDDINFLKVYYPIGDWDNILNRYVCYKYKDFSEYTENDLSFLLEKFLREQEQYPLGECVRKDIHVLFHSMYGQYYNTPEQWYQFKKDYKNGKYDKYV